MKQLIFAGLMMATLHLNAQQRIDVSKYGARANSFADATKAVQLAIAAAKDQPNAVIDFPAGRYDFWPDEAVQTAYYISNSSSETEMPEKRQRVGLMFKDLKNLTLNGNGSRFVFHGKMIAWVIDHSENIQLRNISVDYERPGMSEMTIKSVSPSTVVAKVHPDSKFDIINGKLEWYGEKWVARNYHAVLVKPDRGTLHYSSWEPFLRSKAERVDGLEVRFSGDFSKFKADTGDVLTIRDRYRDYVGAFQNRSKNIKLRQVHMNSMHGLGIVSQFCENLDYDSVFVEPAKNSGRVIASSADGMHFSGCKGQITINHCRFSGLHDDPINVHGTHLKVTEIVSPHTVKLRFMHHQSYGFEAFMVKDSVALLHAASLQIFAANVVRSAKLLGEREMLVEMENPFPPELKVGDAVENITWTPSLTISNSRFERTISRGTLVTTRRKVLIENNVYYRTGMHAILIENDASGWYESGPVMDVTIRNNVFEDCAYNSFPDNYIINISPQNHEKAPNYWVHQNIKIENNVFKAYDHPILGANSTKGLSFVGNRIIKTNFMDAGKKRPALNLTACTRVKIAGNDFGAEKPVLRISQMTKNDIRSDLAFETK